MPVLKLSCLGQDLNQGSADLNENCWIWNLFEFERLESWWKKYQLSTDWTPVTAGKVCLGSHIHNTHFIYHICKTDNF